MGFVNMMKPLKVPHAILLLFLLVLEGVILIYAISPRFTTDMRLARAIAAWTASPSPKTADNLYIAKSHARMKRAVSSVVEWSLITLNAMVIVDVWKRRK